MTCGEARNKMNDYCGGELTGFEIKALERHVSECPDCAKALAQTRKIFDGLHQMREVKAPANLAGDVRRRIESLPGRKYRLGKIFFTRPFKIPLELAATFLIGIFIYRVILPHHPIGKGPDLVVKVDPSLRDKADTFPEDVPRTLKGDINLESTAEKVATDLSQGTAKSPRPRLLPLVKESSHLAEKKSGAGRNFENVEQKQKSPGHPQDKKMSALEEDQILNRKREEIQKDSGEKEKSETGAFDEGRAFPHSGEPSLKHQSELMPVSPKMSPPVTVEVSQPVDASFRSDSKDEEQVEEKSGVTGVVVTQDVTAEKSLSSEQTPKGAGGSPLMDTQTAGFATAGKGDTQTHVAPQSLDSLSVQQNALKEEKFPEKSVNLSQESEGVSEYLSAQPSVQPLASVSEKEKVQKEVRDQKSARQSARPYVWRYLSEEMRKEMFFWIQEKGWKTEYISERTYRISLPRTQKDDFLVWLNTHGKLLNTDETAAPEKSDLYQMLVLYLKLEEAS